MRKIHQVLLVVLSTGASAAAQERPAVVLESARSPPALGARLGAVAAATGFEAWPRAVGLAVAPAVSRSLLARPQLAGREVIQYEVQELSGQAWGQLRVSWRDQSTAAAPPAPEARQGEPSHLAPAQRADRPTVDAYLARRASRERARARQLQGELTVEVLLGPSARAAQELLLLRMADNMLPLEGLGATYLGASRPEGLGDRGWVLESRSRKEVRVELVRRNVALVVSASGSMAEEATGLARRLDELVARQPPRTAADLLALRPTVTLATAPVDGALGYSLLLPEGAQVGGVIAEVDGRRVRAKEDSVAASAGARVRVTVVTRELLAGSAEGVVAGK